jgi:hypothetical protein
MAVVATPLIAMFLYVEPEMDFTDVALNHQGTFHVNDTVWLSFTVSGMNVKDDRIHVAATLTVYPVNTPTPPKGKMIFKRNIADIDAEVQDRNPTVNISANFTADHPGRFVIEVSVIDLIRPRWRDGSGPRQAHLHSEITVV